MANRELRVLVRIITFIVVICIIVPIVGMAIIAASSWFSKAPPPPVLTQIAPSTVIEQLPPLEPRREDTTLGAVSTPSVVDKAVPVVQQEIAVPPTPSPALRAEVVEVKEQVEETAEHLSKTIEEFRKKADELDLGE